MKNFKSILLVLFLLFMSNSYSQKENGSFVEEIISDSIKQVKIFNSDSILMTLKTYKFDFNKNTFNLFQVTEYNSNGSLKDFHSYVEVKIDSNGFYNYEEVSFELDETGRLLKFWLTNDFKLSTHIIYDVKQGGYKKLK